MNQAGNTDKSQKKKPTVRAKADSRLTSFAGDETPYSTSSSDGIPSVLNE